MAQNEQQIESVKLEAASETPNVENQLLIEETTQKNMKSIDDLPSEVLRAILRNIATVDLLKCRQTNHQWNEISSQIMRQRADIQLRFGFDKGRFMRSITYRHCEELLVNVCRPFDKYDTKSLCDLVLCLKKSKFFPCTSFHFDSLAKFDNKDVKSFLSIWGEHIFALKITLDNDSKNVGVLKDLLLKNVINLKKLELQFCEDRFKSPIQLSIASDEFHLPKLEALCVDSRYRKYRGMIENILAAASNLKHFEIKKCTWSQFVLNMGPEIVHEKMVDQRDSITVDDLSMLHTLKKLHCLTNARIYLTDDLIAYWQKSPICLDLKLQSIALSFKASIWKNKQLQSSTTEIINQLLSSSKSVIQELSVEVLGSLPGLVIPMLAKLQKLDLFGWTATEEGTKAINMFPPSFEMADNFPNLKELDMHVVNEKTFPQTQPLKPMRNVEVLRLFGGASAESKEKLMKATPNVKTLLMVEDDFPWKDGKVNIDFGVIAKHLPKLESFGWTICRIGYQYLLHSLDAAITGCPEMVCRKMCAKFRSNDHLTADELDSYQRERCNPSILDLHGLKQLDVNFFFDFDHYCETKGGGECDSDCEKLDCQGECGRNMKDKEDEGGIAPASVFYETGFTKVSKFMAFDLMPQLKVRTHKRME